MKLHLQANPAKPVYLPFPCVPGVLTDTEGIIPIKDGLAEMKKQC
ncbi:hypothetical protein [Akkermansia sp.]|nr:hypothetical protein [uncultured Akkermansia sp.]